MSLAIFQSAPEAWERTTLGEVVERGGGSIQTGPFGSQLHASDYVPVGVPSIMPVNIGDNRLIRDGIACITEKDAQRLSKHIVKRGDIIYSRRGDVERRALVRETEDGWFCGTGCLKVRLGEGAMIPEFASFYLGHPEVRAWIVQHAVGATMPNLNTSIMQAIPFLLPPIAEQRAIAGVLGALDDKIEQNRRTAGVLERLARAIFRAWFIDFLPVKAKADGATSFPGMPQGVFDTLPTEFRDSELGPIPQEWDAQTVDDVADVISGKRPAKKQSSQSEEFNVPQYGGGGHVGYATEALFNVPILITGRVGTLGKVFRTTGECWPSDNTLVVCPQPQHFEFLYFSLARLDLATLNRGSTQPLLTQTDLKQQIVIKPPQALLSTYAIMSGNAFALIDHMMRESRKLAELRDYLLPKLLSGAVRVNEAERVVEEVA